MRRGASQFKQLWRVLSLVALLGLLAVPVECTLMHGPHSMFMMPRPAAAAGAPDADESRHRSDPASRHHVTAAAAAGPGTKPAVHERPAVGASSAVLALITTAFRQVKNDQSQAVAHVATPVLIASVDFTAAPGVPAVLFAPARALGTISRDCPVWPDLSHAVASRLPGPEPPPPELLILLSALPR